MKDTLKAIAESIALILLLPQIFVFLYFFWGTVKIGFDGLLMMKQLALLGLSVSRVGAPFLYLLFFAVRHINRTKARCLATFLI